MNDDVHRLGGSHGSFSLGHNHFTTQSSWRQRMYGKVKRRFRLSAPPKDSLAPLSSPLRPEEEFLVQWRPAPQKGMYRKIERCLLGPTRGGEWTPRITSFRGYQVRHRSPLVRVSWYKPSCDATVLCSILTDLGFVWSVVGMFGWMSDPDKLTLILIANIVTTSKALVPSSVTLVSTSKRGSPSKRIPQALLTGLRCKRQTCRSGHEGDSEGVTLKYALCPIDTTSTHHDEATFSMAFLCMVLYVLKQHGCMAGLQERYVALPLNALT